MTTGVFREPTDSIRCVPRVEISPTKANLIRLCRRSTNVVELNRTGIIFGISPAALSPGDRKRCQEPFPTFGRQVPACTACPTRHDLAQEAMRFQFRLATSAIPVTTPTAPRTVMPTTACIPKPNACGPAIQAFAIAREKPQMKIHPMIFFHRPFMNPLFPRGTN